MVNGHFLKKKEILQHLSYERQHKLYSEKKDLQSPGGRQGSSSSERSSDGPTDSSCQLLKQ